MTTLEELFKAAGMDEALDSMQNMTIFAPSEKALAALPQQFLDDLKQDPEKLKEFLMYHISKCELNIFWLFSINDAFSK